MVTLLEIKLKTIYSHHMINCCCCLCWFFHLANVISHQMEVKFKSVLNYVHGDTVDIALMSRVN